MTEETAVASAASVASAVSVAYVRFESPVRHEQRGCFPGVFFLANSLAREGRLTPEQWDFWRASNDWYDAAYPTPDADVYHRHAGAVAWFKSTATHLLERVPGYMDLLAAHGVPCREVRTDDPGRVVYEDEVQVVAVPHPPAVPSATP
ncbi:hypothetical protein [Streptomyces sp. NPDC059063]|uniref:hypothetical protein n=1 Tax=unclassified Streptomyces TaxID=2593676 RepID=UPI0036D207D0